MHPQGLVGEPTPRVRQWACGAPTSLAYSRKKKKKAPLGRVQLGEARGNSMSQVQAPSTNFPLQGGGAGPPIAILDCFTILQAQCLSPWPLESSCAQHWPVALPHLCCAGCDLALPRARVASQTGTIPSQPPTSLQASAAPTAGGIVPQARPTPPVP